MSWPSYKHPFIVFQKPGKWFGFKLSLVLFIIYFLIFGVTSLRLSWRKTPQDGGKWLDKKLFVRSFPSAIAYLLIPLLYFYPASTGGVDTLLVTVARSFLSYETLLFSLTLAVRVIIVVQSRLFNKERLWQPWQQLQLLDKAEEGIVIASVLASILTRQVEPFFPWNPLCFFMLGLMVFAMEYAWKKCPFTALLDNNPDIYRPVEAYDQLLPQQQRQADELISIICNQNAKTSLSICVSGQWGAGKTSVVNGALDKLAKMENSRCYECIHVNAMELDTLSSLFDYIFLRIRAILKKRGVYVGLRSEYRQFIAASIGKITDPSIATLLEGHFFPSSKDYREQIRLLEGCITHALKDDMILVIVDDVERCEADKAQQFISFIKEIATMRGFVTIFITDYDHLDQRCTQAGLATVDVGSPYYDKFFNCRVDIPPIVLEDAMGQIGRGEQCQQRMAQLGMRSLFEIFTLFENKLPIIARVSTATEDGANREVMLRRLFRVLLSSPRTLIKFQTAIGEGCALLESHYFKLNKLDDETLGAFQLLRVDEMLFLAAYSKACIPAEYFQLKKQGTAYFDHATKGTSEYSWLIMKLGEGLFYEKKDALLSRSFHQAQAEQFFWACLKSEPPEKPEAFNCQNDQWLDAIDREDTDAMESSWKGMVYAVAQVFSREDPSRGAQYLRTLFTFGEMQIRQGKWRAARSLDIFDSLEHSEDLFCHRIAIMKLFWECFHTVLDDAELTMANRLRDFSSDYLPRRILPIYVVAELLIPSRDSRNSRLSNRLRSSFEMLQVRLEPTREILVDVADEIFEEILDLSIPKVDIFQRLDIFVQRVKQWCADHELEQYPDLVDNMELLEISIEDLSYFIRIQELIEKAAAPDRQFRLFTSEIDLDDMGAIIQRFRAVLGINGSERSSQLVTDISTLFDQIRFMNTPLTNAHFNELQELLTTYYEQTHNSVSAYRKILVDHRENTQGKNITLSDEK